MSLACARARYCSFSRTPVSLARYILAGEKKKERERERKGERLKAPARKRQREREREREREQPLRAAMRGLIIAHRRAAD